MNRPIDSSHAGQPRADYVAATLVFCNMLSGTLLIPVVRPFFAASYAGNEPMMHAFFSVNMLGAVVGAPALALLADRSGARRTLAALLALIDGLLLAACTTAPPLGWLLAIRSLQGAASVGALSLLMGYAPRREAGNVHGSRSVGLQGGALVTAIAVGSPLGTLLLRLGPAAAFHVAAVLGLVVAAASLCWLPEGAPRAARGSASGLLKNSLLLRLPALWIGVERFTVGCFVVTFSLYAHRVLGLSDGRVGLLFSCFLVPFAVMSWPMTSLQQRLDRSLLLAVGGLVYGGVFLLLGEVGAALLPLLLIVAGTASAAIYAPSLCLVATLAPPSLRATAMGLANAAGTLGMLLGTATAGITTAVLLRHGMSYQQLYLSLFRVAGAAEVTLVAASLPVLVALSRRQASPPGDVNQAH